MMICIRRNMNKLKERFRVLDHSFRTIKFYDGAYYFLCKEKEKVADIVDLDQQKAEQIIIAVCNNRKP